MIVSVLGGNGFIGHHLARRLKSQGHFVIVADIKKCEYSDDHFNIQMIGDLRDLNFVDSVIGDSDEVYQLAADMGGCQYIFTGEHDADVMRNSAQINMNVCDSLVRNNRDAKIFYSSSACMYPQELQTQHSNTKSGLKESDAYPANPDSEYGWEKLFSERLYSAYARNYGLNVRIARFHNIYGQECTYIGGREKAPASICRKVAEGDLKMWGSGTQTRSFLYIHDCLNAVQLLMKSEFSRPLNIGSEEHVSISHLWAVALEASGKTHEGVIETDMPDNIMGVRGRNSNNDLARKVLNGWEPKYNLKQGIEETYHWILSQVLKDKGFPVAL